VTCQGFDGLWYLDETTVTVADVVVTTELIDAEISKAASYAKSVTLQSMRKDGNLSGKALRDVAKSQIASLKSSPEDLRKQSNRKSISDQVKQIAKDLRSDPDLNTEENRTEMKNILKEVLGVSNPKTFRMIVEGEGDSEIATNLAQTLGDLIKARIESPTIEGSIAEEVDMIAIAAISACANKLGDVQCMNAVLESGEQLVSATVVRTLDGSDIEVVMDTPTARRRLAQTLTVAIPNDSIHEDCNFPIISVVSLGDIEYLLDQNLYDRDTFGRFFGPIGTGVNAKISCMIIVNGQSTIESSDIVGPVKIIFTEVLEPNNYYELAAAVVDTDSMIMNTEDENVGYVQNENAIITTHFSIFTVY
jgi:hypothetical protein